MVKSAFIKSIFRTFQKNISRFVSILLIVFVGVAFVTGVGTLSHILTRSIHEQFVSTHGADIYLKSTSVSGFSSAYIDSVLDIDGVAGVREVFMYEDGATRFIVTDFSLDTTHIISIVEGESISTSTDILVDKTCDVEVGAVVTFFGKEYTIVGRVSNPAIQSTEPEYGNMEQELENIYYIDSTHFAMASMLPTTDLYVELDIESKSNNIFSDKYLSDVDSFCDTISALDSSVVVLTLKENVTYMLVDSYGDKIVVIAAIFPVFFISVVALVVLTTMTRLIEDERAMIGCYRTLGYTKSKIHIKYIVFSLVSCILGSIIGVVLGMYILPNIIYGTFNAMFYMPTMTTTREVLPGIISSFIIVLVIALITVFTLNKELKSKPCELLKHKAPKVGKKIFLEYITFIWSRLKFKYKSSLRNIFRYKTHLIMTVVSVSGSTALVFAGFGLYDIATSPNVTRIPESMLSSFALISAVVILFSTLLCVLVIFNLTNMNIQERNKEMATLRVLGYQNTEVGSYIYREVAIMTTMGIGVGLPLGYVLLLFVFNYLDFGSVHDVQWYSYILTAVMVFMFVLVVDVLLYRKITKIDMNESLKSKE